MTSESLVAIYNFRLMVNHLQMLHFQLNHEVLEFLVCSERKPLLMRGSNVFNEQFLQVALVPH